MWWRRGCAAVVPAVLGFFVAFEGVQALPLPKGELERSCWQRHTRERTRPNLKEATLVEFSNLRHRDRVRSPFMVEFAVRGMGVVPAGKAMPGTGHHHILINTPLPLNIADKIPFSDTHKHFGKGQTFALLDLPTGRHTLRLLFADHEHRPHFVYSREISVDVIGRRNNIAPVIHPDRFDETCAEWYQDELSRPRPPGEWVTVANLRDGEPVASPFALHFGVEGYGVCAAGIGAERTGHFRYEIYREKQMVQQAGLTNGATQATLSLPNGTYTFRLRFVDASGQRDLLPAQDLSLVVNAQNRL